MVNDAIDVLRDDVEISLRNLHVDMIRQFQAQSDEINKLLQQQKTALEGVMNENKSLREENERLKRVY